MPPINLLFHRLAQKEYVEAIRWYNRRSPQKAQDFLAELVKASKRIGKDPERWPIYREGIRWKKLFRFPYVLYYHPMSADEIMVLAVAHARRRPGYFLRRLK